jgi:hypothetical protein
MLSIPNEPISCLTIHQPWASLIFGGYPPLPIKDCENRYWAPPPDITEIWIHAGKTWDDVGAIWISSSFGLDSRLTSDNFPAGVILGKVQITKVTRNIKSPWAMGAQYYKWVLANPQKLQSPISARGQQKIWVFNPPASTKDSDPGVDVNEKPYLPSNGADGYEFTARYCDRCRHDLEAGPEGCGILALALIGEQPEEWRWISGVPTCTKFELPPPPPRKPKRSKIAPGQLKLF